ncbi:maleylpyruvate isomerase family mycothiol-dependent enzyme [Actinacidiphila yeochonensis]|uniref:maleylpyruvate isomerase family mycothiol-dependent enzyme n=1 Tax=Actinacidiphila yeochonensis TaxID=89050 RepID=UPI001E6284B8|nr:maleylpyruvate isomerase family mycothiol-dependent enzyme [Actinacidiphila yeochonensis]
MTGPEEARAECAAGTALLRGLLPGLTDASLREPSALPGWSRGHVWAHIEGVGLALARQARYAVRGERVEVYDGGRPARDAAIEALHGRTADQVAAAVGAALDEVEAAWSAVGPADWQRPVAYRDGALTGAVAAWWRESAIHTADLLMGPTPADWSRPLCRHLVDFLSVRAPADVRLTLTATDDGWTSSRGDGREVRLAGPLADVAAWLAGRAPAARLSGDAPPLLGPWP